MVFYTLDKLHYQVLLHIHQEYEVLLSLPGQGIKSFIRILSIYSTFNSMTFNFYIFLLITKYFPCCNFYLFLY